MQNNVVQIKEKRGGGCLKFFLISFLLFFALFIAGAIYVYLNIGGWMRQGIAEGLNKFAPQVASSLGNTPEESEKIKVVINDLATKIATTPIGLLAATNIMKELATGSAQQIYLLENFKSYAAKNAKLTEAEKSATNKETKRIIFGLVSGKISVTQVQEILNTVSSDLKFSSQELLFEQFTKQLETYGVSIKTIKPNITEDEIRATTDKLKLLADSVQIAPSLNSVVVADEFKKILNDTIDKAVSNQNK